MASPVKRTKPPTVLAERRIGYGKAGYRDRIATRNWTKNSLGPAFTKRPEPMEKNELFKLTAAQEAGQEPLPYSVEQSQMHELLKKKIGGLLKARPSKEHAMHFYRGRSGAYYVALRGISDEKDVLWIRADSPTIKKGIKFLFR
ncbi:MAG: hypothetical protein Q7R47_06770 [Candidatus Diapherotrites archaeon]|nr:hypothetical protein [Candidatus Diapherotrites archaeon]